MIIVMLKELLNDLTEIDDVLFIVKSNGVVSEIRSNGLKLFQPIQDRAWISIDYRLVHPYEQKVKERTP